ncbi:MAG: hypothetical protein GF344_05470, partial [Chitinivibrionales bacterium]|nr:hypothetical protein [Chitinivibrionales bacterium]
MKRLGKTFFFVPFIIYMIAMVPRYGLGEWVEVIAWISTYWVFRLGLKRDVSGEYIAGIMLGATIEFLTEAYWDYNFEVYLYRDISLFVIMGWGYSFAYFLLFSELLYKALTGSTVVRPHDYRILLCDAVVGPVWFIGNEFIGMHVLRLWTYSSAANWVHKIPVINYPIEGLVACVLFSLTFPTFI